MNITYILSVFLMLFGFPYSMQTRGNVYTENAGLPEDTPFLKPSFKVEDKALPEERKGLYGTARADYKRLNSITRWSSVVYRDVARALEGGEAQFYFTGTKPEKIIVRDYGEMYQQLTEYYLRNGQLSFVVEERAAYNMPFYIDSTTMISTGETEVFDIQKSEVSETRSYFENGRLMDQIDNQDCGAPNAAGFTRQEEQRLKGELKALLQLLKSPK